jgi:hypothetical protein
VGAADDRPEATAAGASGAFRDAALRLSRAQRNDEKWGTAAADAADALVGLAGTDPPADELLTFLSPHPAGLALTWTVSRYQSGDVTPIEARDYEHPADAVLWCVEFADSDHVSAELTVSDGAGLRWMAMTGLEGRTAFQLPDIETVHVEADDTGALATTLEHWQALLASWERRASRATARVTVPRPPTLGQRVEGRLQAIEHQQVELLDAVAALGTRIDQLHDDLDRVVQLLGGQTNPSVGSVARALRDRWAGLSR